MKGRVQLREPRRCKHAKRAQRVAGPQLYEGFRCLQLRKCSGLSEHYHSYGQSPPSCGRFCSVESADSTDTVGCMCRFRTSESVFPSAAWSHPPRNALAKRVGTHVVRTAVLFGQCRGNPTPLGTALPTQDIHSVCTTSTSANCVIGSLSKSLLLCVTNIPPASWAVARFSRSIPSRVTSCDCSFRSM